MHHAHVLWPERLLAGLRRFRLLGYLVIGKTLYWMLLLVALRYWGDLDVQRFWWVDTRWPRQGEPIFLSHLATWDAAHYLRLSEVGYVRGNASCAFYPLWPMLVRVCANSVGCAHVTAAIVLANLLSAVGWFLVFQVASRHWGTDTAARTLLLAVAYPGALFFQVNYSESLFFFLTMLLWHGLECRAYGSAITAALLLPMTRAIGVFAVLPILWHLSHVEPVPRGWKNVGHIASQLLARHSLALTGLLVAPVVGWCCYLLTMLLSTGNAFDGFVAQQYWGVHSISNLVNFPKFLIALTTGLHSVCF